MICRFKKRLILNCFQALKIFTENLGIGWDNEQYTIVEKKGLELKLWGLLDC